MSSERGIGIAFTTSVPKITAVARHRCRRPLLTFPSPRCQGFLIGDGAPSSFGACSFMASPFEVFRKNQKVLMVAVTVLAMLAFVLSDAFDMRGGGGGGGRPGDAVAVETR